MVYDQTLVRMRGLRPENQELLLDYLNKEMLSESSEEIYVHAVQGYEKALEEPFTHVDRDKLEAYSRWCENGSGYSATTRYIYGTRLRRLYRHLELEKGSSEREAKVNTDEAFEVLHLDKIRKKYKKKNRSRDKIISPRELDLLIKAAKSARLQAQMAVLYDSACRIGELLSLRVRDVEFYEKYALLRVDGKTGERTVPITRSLPYLRAYLQVHPDPRPDNPLFAHVVLGEVKGLSSGQIQAAIKYLCDKAGIKRRIHPHMFRHTRLTELAKQGLGEYQMKAYAGWTSGSDMANVYIKLGGTSHVDPVLELAGLEVKKDPKKVSSPLKTRKCPKCGQESPGTATHCYSCGWILDEVLAAEKAQDIEKVTSLEKTMAEISRENKELKEAVQGIQEYLEKRLSKAEDLAEQLEALPGEEDGSEEGS
jgi:integrase